MTRRTAAGWFQYQHQQRTQPHHHHEPRHRNPTATGIEPG
jgi:hypothetical protein